MVEVDRKNNSNGLQIHCLTQILTEYTVILGCLLDKPLHYSAGYVINTYPICKCLSSIMAWLKLYFFKRVFVVEVVGIIGTTLMCSPLVEISLFQNDGSLEVNINF